ncbi:MAG: hypothetical protein M3373_07190, partial [Gemmatimonadota bacterium]|nr:hypothetical protein [Gemmatimonadota bacterium]
SIPYSRARITPTIPSRHNRLPLRQKGTDRLDTERRLLVTRLVRRLGNNYALLVGQNTLQLRIDELSEWI